MFCTVSGAGKRGEEDVKTIFQKKALRVKIGGQTSTTSNFFLLHCVFSEISGGVVNESIAAHKNATVANYYKALLRKKTYGDFFVMFCRHTALQVQQERTQVVCSNKEARKRLARRHSRKIRHI